MNEEMLGPRVDPGCLQARAQLKQSAEDFQVHELLDIELSGSGEHVWLQVEKQDMNTEYLAGLLARRFGVPVRNVSYAGIKDRKARTLQWFSIHQPGKHALPELSESLEADGWQVLQCGRHQRKLQRGAHSANHFIILLRNLSGDRAGILTRLQRIVHQGVPNYFGPQRFGLDGENLTQARWWAEQQRYPSSRNKRSRLLSTARSYLFNQVLARRVEDETWDRAQPGDLLSFTQSRSHFLAGAEECHDERLSRLDLHPTGPLSGEGQPETQGYAAGIEQALLAREPELHAWLTNARLSQERRILRLPVPDLQGQFVDSDSLRLEFTLPVGCFATTVLRELLEVETGMADETAGAAESAG